MCFMVQDLSGSSQASFEDPPLASMSTGSPRCNQGWSKTHESWHRLDFLEALFARGLASVNVDILHYRQHVLS